MLVIKIKLITCVGDDKAVAGGGQGTRVSYEDFGGATSQTI